MKRKRKRKKRESFFFNDTATTEIYTLSLHDALPISNYNSKKNGGKMQAKNKSLRVVENLFRQRRVIELSDLHKVVGASSHMTIFRRLRKLNYLSSYTHAGRHYTLYDIPQFNQDGLWHYKNISFSQRGSLKNTVMYLVNKSGAGDRKSVG